MKNNGVKTNGRPLFIAHRGGVTGAGENRLDAIKKSLSEKSISGVEIDLRQTKDRVLVTHHDRGVYVGGQRVWIDELNYDEIKHLDIPRFDEVYNLVEKSGKILNIDLKDELVVEELTKFLSNKKYNGNLYFDSFSLEALLTLEEQLNGGNYCLSLTIKDSRDLSRHLFARVLWILGTVFLSRIAIFLLKRRVKKVKVDGISVYYRFAGPQFIKHLKKMGFKVFIYGAPDKNSVDKLLQYRPDGIKINDLSQVSSK